MESNEDVSDEVFWKRKLREHWKPFTALIVLGVLAIISVIIVLVWFIETSPLGGKGTWTFNRWSLENVVGFIILIILWELLLVALPTGAIIGIGGYLYWRSLPEEEKQEFREREKKEKTRKKETYGGGGGFSLFMFIAFCIYVAVDGHYRTQFGFLKYSYFIYSWLYTVAWMLIVFGIPAAIILFIVYMTKWRKK
jgi:flagellar basal body-associated protein FliL